MLLNHIYDDEHNTGLCVRYPHKAVATAENLRLYMAKLNK